MPRVKINRTRCKGCYLCVVNCPKGLIKVAKELNAKGIKGVYFSGGKPARLQGSLRQTSGCTGCSMCALICPECIIEVYK